MPFDVWDNAANTETIRRAIETKIEKGNLLGPKIAPLKTVRDRKLKRTIIEIEAFGKGQFKARNATPPLYTPRITWDREYIELALLEEMTEIEEDEWHNLTSPDEHIRNKAGVEILTRTRVLQIRNERLTEWMRWQAFQDDLVVQYQETGQEYKLKYGMPSINKPTAGTPWTSRATSTPITNLRAWQKLGKAGGERLLWVHMNTDTYEELEYAQQVKDLLTPTSRSLMLAEQSDIERLLYAGSKIIIHDKGIREDGEETDRGDDAHTLWLPDGKVMLTPANYEFDGEPIADVADGRVAVSVAHDKLEWRQGMQTETIIDHKAKTHFTRQASARIPRIHRPEAFVWATVF